MKRKPLKIIMFFVALGLFMPITIAVFNKIQYLDQISKNIKTVPAFSLYSLNGNLFTIDNLKKDTPSVFIFFNSECQYCKNEAEEIQKHTKEFEKYQLIFVSEENRENIEDFANYYELNGYDNIHFLIDEQGYVASMFNATTIPFILIYNKENRLVEKYKRQVKVEEILNLLNQLN